MRTPSPERTREQAARESIDAALSAFTGRSTPARVGTEPDVEGQAANKEISNHLRQLGMQVQQGAGPVGARVRSRPRAPKPKQKVQVKEEAEVSSESDQPMATPVVADEPAQGDLP
eukprot:12472780-Alexandrium_andersonii.AAC.1